MKTIIILFYLGILSIFDIREKQVPAAPVIGGLFCAFLFYLFQTILYEKSAGQCFWELLKVSAPGLLILTMAYVTQKAGYADAIVLLTLGLVCGFQQVVFAFCAGLWSLTIYSLFLLATHKADKNTRLPYLPFLTVGQVTGLIWCFSK